MLQLQFWFTHGRSNISLPKCSKRYAINSFGSRKPSKRFMQLPELRRQMWPALFLAHLYRCTCVIFVLSINMKSFKLDFQKRQANAPLPLICKFNYRFLTELFQTRNIHIIMDFIHVMMKCNYVHFNLKVKANFRDTNSAVKWPSFTHGILISIKLTWPALCKQWASSIACTFSFKSLKLISRNCTTVICRGVWHYIGNIPK